jgi:two-component system, LytTR family, response regulator LytT
MNVLIFEDEKHTANRLIQLLKEYDQEIKIIDIIGSVQKGIAWLKKNPAPDLIFQDILLNDGNCFEIYETIKINAPVIFTTAFNEYALRSFKVNSIDYLVKPYDFNDIREALDKYKNFREMFIPPESELLKKIMSPEKQDIKKRFLVKIGDRYQSVKCEDIAWFVFDDGLTFAYTFKNTRFPVNFSIDQISALLDQDQFFQINRKYVLNFECIRNIHTYFNNRLKLEIIPCPGEDVIVSRERTRDFKIWLDR